MKALVFLYLCFALLACSTTGAKSDSNVEIVNSAFEQDKQQAFDSVAKIRLERCHTQLTDFRENIFPKNFSYYQKNDDSFEELLRQQQKGVIEAVYQLRMTLRAQINQWGLDDPKMSAECAELAFGIQKLWEQLEEEMAYFLYHKNKDWPLEQKVFMNSKEQLLSNPLIPQEKKLTSLSDLQNGDVVVHTQISLKQEIQNYFIIHKTEDGALYSLEPQGDLAWKMVPLHRSNSWLKRPAESLIVLRHQNSVKAQELVQGILENLNQRRPSSFKNLSFKNYSSVSADPQLVNVMEWKNYLSLHLNRLQVGH